jgi:hypothetical protein
MSNAVEVEALERSIRAKATRRVRAKIGLMWHFAVFAMVNLAMFAIDQRYTPSVQWFVWPLSGWGAALLLHAFAVMSARGLTEDMIRVEIDREKRLRGLA